MRDLERLVEELEYHEVCTGRISVWIGHRDGRAGRGRASPETPRDRFDVLLDAPRACVRRARIPRAVAQRMHAFAERLVRKLPTQLGLFDRDGSKAEAIARVKREVNRGDRRSAVRSAATPPLVGVYKDKSNEYDICDVPGKMCF